MKLRGLANTYIDFTKQSDFHIYGLGLDNNRKLGMVDMYFRGVGGGGKLTTNILARGVQEALGTLVFDRDIDLGIIDSLDHLTEKRIIVGDIGNYGEEEGLMMERVDSGILRVGLYKEEHGWSDEKRKEVYFDVGVNGVDGNEGSIGDMVVVSTQEQFARLVNLALAIQEYNLKGGK